ncbi:MAG: phosphoribosyltransferase [Thaumarchaeota archaeon]|nr:phosphoribosyltransferase [Nitrososphaerota archaeon]
MQNFRYVSWEDYGRLVSNLSEQIRAAGKKFDLVVGIARGGIPVAMVIADQLGVKIDIINVKSYTGIAERSKPRIISTLTEEVKGETLLLVDDLVDYGDTMETVADFLRKQKPGSISTAVLFVKPWSNFKPSFYLEVVDEWVVFPWEKGEVSRLRSDKPAKKIQLEPSA